MDLPCIPSANRASQSFPEPHRASQSLSRLPKHPGVSQSIPELPRDPQTFPDLPNRYQSKNIENTKDLTNDHGKNIEKTKKNH